MGVSYKRDATEKWREYIAAYKIYRTKEYKDLKNIYHQIKSGKKVIDIFQVIKRGGVHKNGHPRLAIAQIKTKSVRCLYYTNGSVYYFNHDSRWDNYAKASDVSLKLCLPPFSLEKDFTGWTPDKLILNAPVPPVPPRYMPKIITGDYYILWEVDEWKMTPPTDPWLLKRVAPTVFTVLAGWDLTDIEKSVMHGRMM